MFGVDCFVYFLVDLIVVFDVLVVEGLFGYFDCLMFLFVVDLCFGLLVNDVDLVSWVWNFDVLVGVYSSFVVIYLLVFIELCGDW